MRTSVILPAVHAMTSDRIRIVYLVSTLRRAGPTTQLQNILRNLDLDAFDPVVVTLSREPADSMLPAFEAGGARVRSLALSRARALFHHRWRRDIESAAGGSLAARCVIHSQGVRADVVAARALAGLPRIATARNYPYEDYVMKFGPLIGRLMARAQLRALREMSAVVACSSSLAEKLQLHGLNPVVIRNGVDTLRFRPATRDARLQARHALGIGEDRCVGVCVGSLVRLKNPVGVVRAVRALEAPHLQIVFVGAGDQDAACRREAAGDARIRFAGQVDDVLPWLCAADFLVSASRSEGMPNAVLEAIACGLPVILSDIEPHAELLRLAPQAGLTFDPGDDTALAGAMRRISTPGGAGRGLGIDEAGELFGAEAMSRRYQALYERLGA